MKDNKDLTRAEKVAKIGNIVKDNPICMMATNLVKTPFSVYPMTTLEVVEKGDFIFFASKQSAPFKEIEKDNKVQLIYNNPIRQEYLSVFGHATHIIDDLRLQKLWKPIMNNWFNGKDDPDLVILSVSIVSANYWITDKHDMISYFENQSTITEESGFINLQNYGETKKEVK
jgi:general stress protein 26